MTAMTRGPLPARVYWRRRLVLALVVLALVAVTLRLVGLGSDPAPEAGRPQAAQAAAEAEEAEEAEEEEPSVTAPDTPSETRTRQPAVEEKAAQRDQETVLAEPEGECSDRDVAVTPSVRDAIGGAPITFVLELRTITTPACTWQVSPSTLTMKITSGDDDIWSSQDCPRAIPSEELTLRNDDSVRVPVTWSAKRSDAECSGLTDWAMPGWYYVNASALAGEPSDLHFELEQPEPGVEKRYVDRKPRQQLQQRQDDEQGNGRGGDRGGDRGDDPGGDRHGRRDQRRGNG